MEKIYDEDEEGMTEVQAQRLVQWLINHGYTKEEANAALVYVMTGIGNE